MSVSFASLFAGIVVYWFRRNHATIPLGSGFMDILASSEPTMKRRDLATIIRSPEYEKMGEDDLIILAHEMLVNYIKPNMNQEDTIHVKSDLATLLIRLQTIRTTAAIGAIGKDGGNGARASGKQAEGAKRDTHGVAPHIRGLSGQSVSTAHL